MTITPLSLGLLLAMAAALASWLGYMARQHTKQAEHNARTATVMASVLEDVEQLERKHDALADEFKTHVLEGARRRIEELELELAAAKRLPPVPHNP